jgi:hypothetical protein
VGRRLTGTSLLADWAICGLLIQVTIILKSDEKTRWNLRRPSIRYLWLMEYLYGLNSMVLECYGHSAGGCGGARLWL